MTEGDDVYFVKTHKRRKADGYPCIYLVRDGRDAVVSMARLRASSDSTTDNSELLFKRLLSEEITRPYVAGQPSLGTWGGHVLSWLNRGDAPLSVLRYEDFIVDPRAAVQGAVSSLAPDLVPVMDVQIPSFGDLHAVDAEFFRRGAVGSHRDEIPDDLNELFWAQPENATAMQRLGYGK
jgi:hypothetical protein